MSIAGNMDIVMGHQAADTDMVMGHHADTDMAVTVDSLNRKNRKRRKNTTKR